jgi:putative transcriptional regulator
MTIEHHPPDTMLLAFAAGTLDLGQRVAVATHLVSCPHCRGFARAMEHAGGEMLANLPPAAMGADALEKVQARLSGDTRPSERAAASFVPDTEIPSLPGFVRRYRFGAWKWIAPSVHLRPIVLPEPCDTRVFLLRSGPGTRMLQHTHTDVELTCILSGAFSHEGGRYGPGDFDLGDATVDHRPVVDTGEECLCLVAMQGKLRLDGLLGRIIQPFVRI